MNHILFITLTVISLNHILISAPRNLLTKEELVDDSEGNFNSIAVQETLLVENIIKTNKLVIDKELDANEVIIDQSTITNTTILNLTATNSYIDNLNANTLNVSGTSVVGCDVFVDCNLYIPETTASNQGVIFKYSGTTAAPTTIPFLHNAGTDSTFLGENSGNFTGGNENTAVGTATLNNVINTSVKNTAMGWHALEQNSGSYNTAFGAQALLQNTGGFENVAIGYSPLSANTIGYQNIAIGTALFGNTSGFGNIALGNTCLQKVQNGNNNIGLGIAAGANLFSSNNICIGTYAGSNLDVGSNNIAISNAGTSSDAGVIRIGSIGTHTTNFQAGIRGVTAGVADTSVVNIDTNGQLGTGIITNNINLTGSTSTGGNILKNGILFIHNYGDTNTFLGLNAGNITTTSQRNTGIGENTLTTLTSGNFNTAVGSGALFSNTTGANNTAIGVNTLTLNTTGQLNTAIGSIALAKNTTGQLNTAVGAGALFSNITGSNNTAMGYSALTLNTTGDYNTAIGTEALKNNITGSNNIVIGQNAGSNITKSNNILIGNTGLTTDSGVIRIGTTGTHNLNIQSGIFGSPAIGTANVLINVNGEITTTSSSEKYKENIHPLSSVTLDKFKQLSPVSFTYINDENHATQYGFIAEEVAPLLPELIVYNTDGSIYSIKYHLMYALLYAWLQNIRQQQDADQTRLNTCEEIINTLRTDLQNAQSLITALAARVVALENILNNNA